MFSGETRGPTPGPGPMDTYEVSKSLWTEVYDFALTRGYTFENAGTATANNHPVQSVCSESTGNLKKVDGANR